VAAGDGRISSIGSTRATDAAGAAAGAGVTLATAGLSADLLASSASSMTATATANQILRVELPPVLVGGVTCAAGGDVADGVAAVGDVEGGNIGDLAVVAAAPL